VQSGFLSETAQNIFGAGQTFGAESEAEMAYGLLVQKSHLHQK
jgi:hypothetical protein